MVEQAHIQQGSSANREGGARQGSILVLFSRYSGRASLCPEFKFVFSKNAEPEWNSDLAKVYYSCTDSNIGQRQCLSGEGPSMMNDPVVTGTTKESFIRNLIKGCLVRYKEQPAKPSPSLDCGTRDMM
jgi:hypothetical protein